MPQPEHPFWDEVDGRQALPPASSHLGLRFLDAERGSGRIRVAFAPRAEFAAMLDDTLGAAVATTLAPNEFALSLEIKVNFLRPAALAPLIGEGSVTRRGRSVAFVEGALRDEANELLATATSTVRILDSPASHG